MDNDIRSITQAGLFFLVFLFTSIILYALLSTPVETLLNGFQNLNVDTNVNAKLTEYVPLFRTAIKIVFVMGIAAPIAWFIFWIFTRETYSGLIRRY